jgi:hypothetical protein
MTAPQRPRVRNTATPRRPPPALESVREQVACIRALLDEIERVAPVSAAGWNLSEQIVDELTRLGTRSLEAATELSRAIVATHGSV